MTTTPKNNQSSSKLAIVNIVLVVNALCWYLYFFSFLKTNSGFTGNNLVIIIGFNILAVAISAVISSKIIEISKKRLKFLFYWMGIGALLSPLVLTIGNLSFINVIIFASALGAYFGFGCPVLMGYYSATTKGANRAKISGLTIFFTYICFIILTLFFNAVIGIAIMLTAWKIIGLLAIVFLKPDEVAIKQEDIISYPEVLKKRIVLLYFIPWLMFSIVNNFAFPVLYVGFGVDLVNAITLVENILVGFFALLFGFLADRLGRRRLVFFGFVMLGLGYAILGLLPTYNRGLYFYTFADSIAWSIFSPLFLLTIWGDIAGKKDGGKYFVIGFLPYMLSSFLQVLFSSYVMEFITVNDLASVFSFASFFLFLAAVPLFLVPDSISESERKNNVLKDYSAKAQKMVEDFNKRLEKEKQKG
ncbi:MAG: hypothetical protein FWH37_01110 [Candidatus Bathyarchaeota archaeon]|nr:hypothetical protein [Candidatus Termiticorpusculum sp.]